MSSQPGFAPVSFGSIWHLFGKCYEHGEGVSECLIPLILPPAADPSDSDSDSELSSSSLEDKPGPGGSRGSPGRKLPAGMGEELHILVPGGWEVLGCSGSWLSVGFLPGSFHGLQHSRVLGWELLLAPCPCPAPHCCLSRAGIAGVLWEQSTGTGGDSAPGGSCLELGSSCSFRIQLSVCSRSLSLCPVLAAPTRGPSQATSRALGTPQSPWLSGSHSSLGSEQGAELSPTESGQSDQPWDRHESDAATSTPGKLHPLPSSLLF